MQPLPDGVFDRADARALGWSDSALTRAVRSGRVHSLRRGQYTVSAVGEHPRLAALAAARCCTGSVISHRSATLWQELPLLGVAPQRPDLTVQPGCTGDVAGALLHRATLWPEDVMTQSGAAVTTPARTVVDLARSSSTAATVVTADAALHRGLCTSAQLDEVLARCWRWPGRRRAWRSLQLIDARSESPLESISRLALRWMRLPEPELQAVILRADGAFVARGDFYWPESGVLGEADGASKYTDREVLIAEKHRQEALETLGLVVVRWGWTDVTAAPQRLRTRLLAAFERGTHRDRSGFPRLWSVQAA